jgi:hypothetical protein
MERGELIVETVKIGMNDRRLFIGRVAELFAMQVSWYGVIFFSIVCLCYFYLFVAFVYLLALFTCILQCQTSRSMRIEESF